MSALPETIYTEGIIPQSEWSDKDGWAGHIEQIDTTNAKLSIFIYVFGNATQCSKVSKLDFANVIIEPDEKSKIQYSKGIDRNVAWSFYSLNSDADDPLDKYFEDENNQVPNPNFIFHTPSECQWMQCLQDSIKQHYRNVTVDVVDAKTQTNHHCQMNHHMHRRTTTCTCVHTPIYVLNIQSYNYLPLAKN